MKPGQFRRRIQLLPSPVLMLVTEPMQQARLTEIVRQAEEGGVNIVQLRDRTLSPSELTLAAADLKMKLRESLLLVNGSPSAAVEAQAHGVHLPEQGVPIAQARTKVGTERLVGRSVHSIEAAVNAEKEGADYLVAGTIFTSRSHPGSKPAGLGFLRDVCASVSIPVIAIGGIIPDNAADCIQAGAAGIAVLSSIMQATDPRAVAAEYRASLAGG